MKINCTDEEIFIFEKISDAANALSIPAFIVGGFVRDKILNRKTKDADIVCEGDGIKLARATAEKFSPKPNVSFFKNFGTAQIKIFLNRLQKSITQFSSMLFLLTKSKICLLILETIT